mmetsp:Transcript_20992/g.49087  ORF Transcript_20992/g.49087 Transcript_20992/m.49087 type:complete len:283 (+) Transcript_20992:514-1362(+)
MVICAETSKGTARPCLLRMGQSAPCVRMTGRLNDSKGYARNSRATWALRCPGLPHERVEPGERSVAPGCGLALRLLARRLRATVAHCPLPLAARWAHAGLPLSERPVLLRATLGMPLSGPRVNVSPGRHPMLEQASGLDLRKHAQPVLLASTRRPATRRAHCAPPGSSPVLPRLPAQPAPPTRGVTLAVPPACVTQATLGDPALPARPAPSSPPPAPPPAPPAPSAPHPPQAKPPAPPAALASSPPPLGPRRAQPAPRGNTRAPAPLCAPTAPRGTRPRPAL